MWNEEAIEYYDDLQDNENEIVLISGELAGKMCAVIEAIQSHMLNPNRRTLIIIEEALESLHEEV